MQVYSVVGQQRLPIAGQINFAGGLLLFCFALWVWTAHRLPTV